MSDRWQLVQIFRNIFRTPLPNPVSATTWGYVTKIGRTIWSFSILIIYTSHSRPPFPQWLIRKLLSPFLVRQLSLMLNQFCPPFRAGFIMQCTKHVMKAPVHQGHHKNKGPRITEEPQKTRALEQLGHHRNKGLRTIGAP